MQSEQDVTNKRKAQAKLKIIKDFSFLLKYRPIAVDEYTTKYILEEGEGQLIADLLHQFHIVFSLKSYSYEGKFINQYKQGKVNKSDENNQFIKYLVNMKVGEKAWLNISEEPVYRLKEIDEELKEFQNAGMIDQEDFNGGQMYDEFEEIETTDKGQRNGTHYEITLLRVQYKNDNTLSGKKLVQSQKKEEARNHFQKKQYLEALKIYKFLTDINTGCSKKHFSEEELFEIQDMANNARVNYIRCYFKMIEQKDFIQHETHQNVEITLKYLIERKSNDCVVHYLHAKWLLKERMLDNAKEAAQRSYSLKKEEGTLQLLKIINEERRNKGKIKVKV